MIQLWNVHDANLLNEGVLMQYFKVNKNGKLHEYFSCATNENQLTKIEQVLTEIKLAGTYTIFRNVYIDQDPSVPGSTIEWVDAGYTKVVA